MISVKEFIETDCNNIINDLWENYTVQRTPNGFHYLNSPFQNLQDILDDFESRLNDPWDDLENDGEWDGDVAFIEQCKLEITKEYQIILEQRKQFASKHNMANFM